MRNHKQARELPLAFLSLYWQNKKQPNNKIMEKKEPIELVMEAIANSDSVTLEDMESLDIRKKN